MDERQIVVVGYDDAELLDIACVTTTLSMANMVGEVRPPYRTRMASPGGQPVVCSGGMTLQSHRSLERLTGPIDTLVVSGGWGYRRAAADPLIVAHVRRLARESRRVASVCTGASILAAAGLLDGRRATTHWWFAGELAARHPLISVDPDPIYIRDGAVITSAGVTSALDLTLSFIEEDHGAELARLVSRVLVTYLQRPGNQAQVSMFTSAPPPDHDLVRQVMDHVSANLAGDLTTTALADAAGVSPRHLTRLFITHLGQSPGRFVRHARIEAAAHLVSSTSLPMPRVAARCGFGTAETLRQAFVDRYGIPPSRYRAIHNRPSAG
ncbi:GlxA family transcriptional regulator [Streptosporangium sp. NPDC050855]|uniref:GlxA family transcriptional regulator n=1 Tax=Streptosporangium sp. NPDC050855 TaxID=3366194 RepID=UPI0037B6454A